MLDQSDSELLFGHRRLTGALLGTVAGTQVGIEQNARSYGNQGNAQRQALETVKHSMGRILARKVNHASYLRKTFNRELNPGFGGCSLVAPRQNPKSAQPVYRYFRDTTLGGQTRGETDIDIPAMENEVFGQVIQMKTIACITGILMALSLTTTLGEDKKTELSATGQVIKTETVRGDSLSAAWREKLAKQVFSDKSSDRIVGKRFVFSGPL